MEKSYSPAVVVLVSLTKPFSMLLRVTFASPTVAPDLSVTTPCSEVVPVCAPAGGRNQYKEYEAANKAALHKRKEVHELFLSNENCIWLGPAAEISRAYRPLTNRNATDGPSYQDWKCRT